MSVLYDPYGNRKYLTATERRMFLETAGQCSADIRTFCLTPAYTGARISEVLALMPRQIDCVIIIRCLKKRRSGIFRAVPVPAELLEELDRVHDVRAAKIDGKRICNTYMEFVPRDRLASCQSLYALSWHCGPPYNAERIASQLRRLCAAIGVPINRVKKWLGHSRLTTTEIYADAVGAEEQAIAARFWQTFGDKGDISAA